MYFSRKIQHTIARLQHQELPARDQTGEPNNSTSFLPYIAGTTDGIAKCPKREGIKTILQAQRKIRHVLAFSRSKTATVSSRYLRVSDIATRFSLHREMWCRPN